MIPNTIRSALLLLLLLLLSGCQTLMQKESEKLIQERLKSYEATVRWGYPGQAYNFLREDLGKKVVLPKNLEKIKVTDYKVIQRPDLVKKHLARQVVVIGYVHDDRQVERSITDIQLWEFDEEKRVWFRANMVPEYQ